MLKLAFRNMFRHRTRTALTLGVIVLGVVGLIVAGGFVEDVFVQLRESTIHSRFGHLQVYKAGYLRVGRRDPYGYMIEASAPLTERLSGMPHVVNVMSRVVFSGLARNGRADLPVIGEGVEAEREARLGSAMQIVMGRQLQAGDTFGILVGQGVAQTLHLEPGDYLTLLLSTPSGALNSLEFELIGIFRTFSKDYDDRAVRIPLSAAQELLATDAVHSIVVQLDDTNHTGSALEAIRSVLSSEYEIEPWYELADFYRKTVALYKRQFGALELIVLILVLLSVTNSVNMAVYERTGEFGTLMALGHRRSRVFRLVLVENMLLGLLGGISGAALAAALAIGISGMGISMPPPPGSNVGYTAHIRLVPWVIVAAFAIGSMATVLASIWPAQRLVRLPVVEALQDNV